MNKLLLVGIGGFIGAILRYMVSGWAQRGASFPYGTLTVNVLGSFLLGTMMYLVEYEGLLSEEQRLLLAVGMMGSFTTMSTFSYESFKLFENNEILKFGLNVIGNLFLSLLGIFFGRTVVLTIWK